MPSRYTWTTECIYNLRVHTRHSWTLIAASVKYCHLFSRLKECAGFLSLVRKDFTASIFSVTEVSNWIILRIGFYVHSLTPSGLGALWFFFWKCWHKFFYARCTCFKFACGADNRSCFWWSSFWSVSLSGFRPLWNFGLGNRVKKVGVFATAPTCVIDLWSIYFLSSNCRCVCVHVREKFLSLR
jgi:hypothetical protein